jgi:hypothetical protein
VRREKGKNGRKEERKKMKKERERESFCIGMHFLKKQIAVSGKKHKHPHTHTHTHTKKNRT